MVPLDAVLDLLASCTFARARDIVGIDAHWTVAEHAVARNGRVELMPRIEISCFQVVVEQYERVEYDTWEHDERIGEFDAEIGRKGGRQKVHVLNGMRVEVGRGDVPVRTDGQYGWCTCALI